MTKKSKFVERAKYWCGASANLGYDQYNRWDIRVGGESDCSSLTYWCLWEAGYLTKPTFKNGQPPTNRNWYTGTIKNDLVKAGWKAVRPSGKPKTGYVCLNEGCHVAMCIDDNGRLAQASIDERGQATGGKSGDQTGNETNISNYYNYPWDWFLIPPAESGSSTSSSGTGGTSGSKAPAATLKYRVSVYKNGKTWKAECTGNKETGSTTSTIKWFACNAPKYRVKTVNSGWLPYVTKYNIKDLEYGCAGDGSAITAIEIYSSSYQYQVYTKTSKWLPAMIGRKDTGGSSDTYAGDGSYIYKFKGKNA